MRGAVGDRAGRNNLSPKATKQWILVAQATVRPQARTVTYSRHILSPKSHAASPAVVAVSMASMFQSFPLLRKAAPRLSRQFFTCRARHASTKPASAARPAYKSVRQTPFLNAFRSQSSHAPTHSTSPSTSRFTSPLGALSSTISIDAARTAATKKALFPQTSDKVVAYWLLGSAASVFGIVVFGGLTRLTESGLSITEWRPVTGSLPPTTPSAWDAEFAKYRSSPEFALLNPHMTLPEFQQIYWMEWTHRLWGRAVGLSFLLPTAYFVARRRVSAPVAARLVGICGLIGVQGVIGWWMVKSGLKDDLFAPGSHPRVSQYRLAAHLGAAFVVYAAMLTSGLSILRERALLADPAAAQNHLDVLRNPALRPFRRYVGLLAALVFTTAMSGALVAGLDAGLIYNEFPYMGLGLTPPRKELWDPWYAHAADKSDLWWRNMLENPSLVQLDHRVLATTTFTAVMALWAYARFSPRVRSALPPNAVRGVRGVVYLVWLQVALGISTLLYLVPVPLASAHQAGSLALLTGVLVLGSRVWVPRRAARLLAEVQRGKVMGGGAVRGWSGRGVGPGVGNLEQKRA